MKNIQASAVLECSLHVIEDMPCNTDLEVYPLNIEDPWTDILASVA